MPKHQQSTKSASPTFELTANGYLALVALLVRSEVMTLIDVRVGISKLNPKELTNAEVREALVALEGEGFVAAKPTDSLRVYAITPKGADLVAQINDLTFKREETERSWWQWWRPN